LILFFPPCLCEATVLQEDIGDHGHQRVAMKTSPGSPLEVIKPVFLFQLLMRLFANPWCFGERGLQRIVRLMSWFDISAL
jgi:hypothetical protein